MAQDAATISSTDSPVLATAGSSRSPGRRSVAWRAVGWIMAYPVVWAGVTLLRAPTILDEGTGNPWWYP